MTLKSSTMSVWIWSRVEDLNGCIKTKHPHCKISFVVFRWSQTCSLHDEIESRPLLPTDIPVNDTSKRLHGSKWTILLDTNSFFLMLRDESYRSAFMSLLSIAHPFHFKMDTSRNRKKLFQIPLFLNAHVLGKMDIPDISCKVDTYGS